MRYSLGTAGAAGFFQATVGLENGMEPVEINR
jgi:hypothetical protein